MDLVMDSIWATVLFTWVVIVVYPLTKSLYGYMRKKGLGHSKTVYYNRKVIHILTGGLAAVLVPYLFSSPLLPAVFAATLAVLTYLPHRRNRLMYWFQVEDNMYEVHFCIMWGMVITLGWVIFHNWWYGVIPVAFMAFGDGVTGIVRNVLYNRRNKSWIGNLAMAAVTIPIGYIGLGYTGALAGLIASVIEHFEVTAMIDDNITVPLTSFLTILVLQLI